ncbi:hypothetical protein N0B51_12920 [Tsuneonella sp. YG55]|uniref:Tetratricopeptide repeat protein n=1 Tax=Tsuneonella litorea TaxID=2976475 RepID=A0A9X3ALK3_9SPHN|nr:hypothetical protein [Tsuneonella litorea]
MPDKGGTDAIGAASTDRRKIVLAGGFAIGAAALGGWTALRRPRTDPRAVELTRQADLLMKSGLPGSTRQATSNLEMAVEIDPTYADGWGYLALMYRHAMNGYAAGERRNLTVMMDSAASRALKLDPDQADARLAKALERPFYRDWNASEARLRRIVRDHPDHWYANAQLALLLMDVGRANEALAFRERVIAIDTKIPVAWSLLALNRLQANRLHEADMALEHAHAQWPNHPALWLTRYRVLLETGRPLEASQFVRSRASRPDGFGDEMVASMAAEADAIADGGQRARASAVSQVRRRLTEAEVAGDAAPMLAMLGEPARALAVAAAYFLGGTVESRQWPAPDQWTARSTAMLFFPSFLQLAGMPQYRDLLARSGLDDYWQRSGSQPDFRRS